MTKALPLYTILLAGTVLPPAVLAQQIVGPAYEAVNPPAVRHTQNDYQLAAAVCQDPWIGQAYLYLNLNINGHAPTRNDPSGAGSTQNQCNYTNYGSWPDFPTLIANVRRYFSPNVAAPAATAGQATITGPSTLIPAQTATVTWTVSQQGSPCQSGVRVLMNGTLQMGNAVALSGKQSLIPATTYPNGTHITLALIDLCSGRVISNSFAATIGIPVNTSSSFAQLSFRGVPGSQVFLLNGTIIRNPHPLDSAGHVIAWDGTAIVAQGGGNYIDGSGVVTTANNFALKVNYGVISNDGGSIVAQGGGNIVAQGGGNIVAQGGGNFTNQAGIGTAISTAAIANIGAFNNRASPGYTLASLPSQNAAPAVITGPATWVAGQPATVTWTFAQPAPACASGVRVVMNGNIQTGTAVMLSAGRVTIPAATYPANTTTTLSLVDLCTGRIISAAYNSRVVAGAPPTAVFAPLSASITGPAAWIHGQQATVTWRVLQQGPACASGVRVVLNGSIQTGAPVSLLANQAAIPATTWAANTAVNLALMDVCTGRIISNTVALTLK